MKISLENLGVLKQAEFELGDLTIVCGNNNTGKTYATYALFGFLFDWRDNLDVKIPGRQITALLNDGVTRIDVTHFIEKSNDILVRGCQTYSQQLSRIFASKSIHFKNSKFRVDVDPEKIPMAASRAFDRKIRSNKGEIFSLTKAEGEMVLVASLLGNTDNMELPGSIIRDVMSSAINDVMFGSFFPCPFIVSAERTGAVIFRKELNFARNRLLEEMSRTDKDIDPMKLLFKTYQDYPLPVKINVDFTRQLGSVAKEDSFLIDEHPQVLEDFADIIGGQYVVGSNDTLYFKPAGARRRLAMDESSSAVRSLLDVGFYLRHVARRGDLLMMDEPELNLHPENQRRIARLFARLINLGVRVFVTTHSDYIVKELNTLIMLNPDRPGLRRIAEREGYQAEELISADKVRVYVAERAPTKLRHSTREVECQTLTQARIDPQRGIEARSFDETINRMNEIQESIVWGGDD